MSLEESTGPTSRHPNIADLACSVEEPLLRSPTPVSSAVADGDGGNDASKRAPPVLSDGLPWAESALLKSLYFLSFLSGSSWGRFSAIFYNDHGLMAQQIGVIEGLRGVTPALTGVCWGYLADRFRCRKLVWVGTKVCHTLVLPWLALPSVSASFAKILSVSVGAQVFEDNGAILDSYTLERLGTGQKQLYGRYRLYRAVSCGLGSIAMGFVADHFGIAWIFLMIGAGSVLYVVLVVCFIPSTINADDADDGETNDKAGGMQMNDASELLRLLLKPRVFFFLLEVIVMGAAMATVERLLFLYLVNDLDASTLLCGLCIGVNVVFELPFFWYAQSILHHLGTDGMFALAMVCYVVRVFCYTLLSPATRVWILALESMHGVTFASFWLVTTDISKNLIDEGAGGRWSTTIPSLVQQLYWAVGGTIGLVGGGYMIDHYGQRNLYRLTSSVVCCILLIHLAGSALVRSRCFALGSLLPEGPHQDKSKENTPESSAGVGKVV